MATTPIIAQQKVNEIKYYIKAALSNIELAYSDIEKGIILNGTNSTLTNYLSRLNKLKGDLDTFINGSEKTYGTLAYIVKFINMGK